ncbi:MAG: hypothetical protein QGF07_00180, partial [Phycisphaerales bacterium]|nr:hypothetical protein [Phycisphaerales bacterium]
MSLKKPYFLKNATLIARKTWITVVKPNNEQQNRLTLDQIHGKPVPGISAFTEDEILFGRSPECSLQL